MKLYTLTELAGDLQIDETEAESLRRRHRWPHVKVGRRNVRFTETQVAAIIAQHTVGAPGPRSASTADNGLTSRSKARA